VCVDLVKGSIGFIGEVFEVVTQVDLGLTSAGRFDSADSAISGNDVNQKPGASHPTCHPSPSDLT
jgi:hypothetical protein